MNDEDNLIRPLYLDLMKKCLTRSVFKNQFEFVLLSGKGIRNFIQKIIKPRSYRLVRPADPNPAGVMGWLVEGETMIGIKRLDHLEKCISELLHENIPGDLIETGVWRGGATIFMRAALKAYQDTQRIVWVADSFQGLPKPNAKEYPADSKDRLWTQEVLAVSLEEVKDNFRRYELLDDQVRFLVGWFKDTLPHAPFKKLALLRLDGDMYESTLDALRHLYPKLSVGGYVIIDDYGVMGSCKKAVEDFRERNGISEEIQKVDASCVFWKRSK